MYLVPKKRKRVRKVHKITFKNGDNMELGLGKQYIVTLHEGEVFSIRITKISNELIEGNTSLLCTAYSDDGEVDVTTRKFLIKDLHEIKCAPYSPEEYAKYELENNPKYQLNRH